MKSMWPPLAEIFFMTNFYTARGAMDPLAPRIRYCSPPSPVKKSHMKKMATEGGRIDFMFLGPLPSPAAGSATGTAVMLY